MNSSSEGEIIKLDSFYEPIEIPSQAQPTEPTIPAVPEPTVVAPAEPVVAAVDSSAAEPEPVTVIPPGRTVWSNLGYLFRDVEKKLPQDISIPDDLTPQAFWDILTKEVENKYKSEHTDDLEELKIRQRELLREKGWAEDQIERGIKYAELISDGVDDQEIEQHAYLDALVTADVPDEESELEYLRRFQQLRNQDPDMVELFLEQNMKGADKAEVRKQAVEGARQSIKQHRDQSLQAVKQRSEAARAQAKVEAEKEKDSYQKVISSGFFGIKPTKEEGEKLMKAMFSVAGYDDIHTPKGVGKSPKTQEAIIWEKVLSDPAKRLAHLYIELNGMDKIMSAANVSAGASLLKAVEQSASQLTTLPPVPRTERPEQVSVPEGGFILSL